MKCCLKQTSCQLFEKDKLMKDTLAMIDHNQWPMKKYPVKLVTAHMISMPYPRIGVTPPDTSLQKQKPHTHQTPN